MKPTDETVKQIRRYLVVAMALAVALMVVYLNYRIENVEVKIDYSVIQPALADDEIDSNLHSIDPKMCSLDAVVCPDELNDDAVKAESMLTGTPMAGLGSLIVETAKEYDVSWSLIIGIAEAESNRGASYVHAYDVNCHNPFGIKPPTKTGQRDDGSYLRCYTDWESGIHTMTSLLARRYKNQTPEQMCGVYVQPCNPNWLKTVNKYYQK